MTQNYVTATFTRHMSDDLDVIRSTPWATADNALEIQFLSEFEEFEGRLHITEMGSGPDQYEIVVRIDLEGDLQDPQSVLASTVAALQEVYNEEMAGGSFEVDKIVIGGNEYLAVDLVASAGPGI
jgi:hypothetical protein